MPIVNYTSYSLTSKYLRTNTRTKFHFSKDKLYFDTYICYEQDFFKKYEPTKKTKLFYFLKWETVCTELFKTDFVELVLEKFKRLLLHFYNIPIRFQLHGLRLRNRRCCRVLLLLPKYLPTCFGKSGLKTYLPCLHELPTD